jgi:MHS family proline/betaine transporter-like MFS transporter
MLSLIRLLRQELGGEMSSAQRRRVVAAGMIGNTLEWYDFAIYSYFAAQIGRHFFPHEDAVAQLLSTFGVFSVGYLMRPIGGVIVGHIGDTLGRRAALTFSVSAMAIPTFMIGLLPGYQTIGVLAPVGLTLLRVVQGLSVGGVVIPDLLRPDPPTATGEAPRPPMPVGTASPEREFGN